MTEAIAVEAREPCAAVLPAIAGSTPHWRLQARAKDTAGGRPLAVKLSLTTDNSSSSNDSSGAAAAAAVAPVGSLAGGLGRRTFAAMRSSGSAGPAQQGGGGRRSAAEERARRGEETAPRGKRFGIAPPALRTEVDSLPCGRRPLMGPATVEEETLFGSRRVVRGEGGVSAARREPLEMSQAKVMTRKRVTHFRTQLRNSIPEACPGDKAYHCPSQSDGYFRDAAARNAKCGVEKLAGAPAHERQQQRCGLSASAEDVKAVSALPKYPKDEAAWSFLTKK